jgi:pyruvate/2-oxoglutarate dehydrogenase complex dihydrolipoamide dehydrogenase (E3) component
MSHVLTPDICVVGGGSGGLSVAAAAAAFGVEVVLAEKGPMGGDCLNTGCVPSKALIAAARAARHARDAGGFGVSTGEVHVDFAAVNAHVHGVIEAIAPHDSVERFEGLGVRVLQDAARFVDARTVACAGMLVRARRFVIATGSRPAVPPIPGLDRVPYLTNETVFGLTECPGHLLVIGGGPIGAELAQAHARLGARVSVVEAERVLGREDPALVAPVLEALRADGVDMVEGARVVAVEGRAGDIRLTLECDGARREIAGTHLLVAVGRRPSIGGLGLEAAGIAHGPRGIEVGSDLRTSNRRVYAIGDVAGGAQFTHVAGYHAGLVVRSILFRLPARENRDILPRVTFTEPEIGHVGLTPDEARARFGDKAVRVLEAPFSGNDRARTERATQGCVRLVVAGRGRIVGGAVVGPSGGEITNLLSVLVARRMSVREMASVVLPYPSLSEAVRRAAISYYAESTKNPWLRRVLRLLAWFG